MAHRNRRQFLGQLAGGLAATTGLATRSLSAQTHGPHPILDSPAAPDEDYWRLVKEQFPLRRGLILMNAANLCPSPYPVVEEVERWTRDVDADASFQNRAKFGPLREQARTIIADLIGASPEEIAITRNTSEGNNSVVNGVTLGPGDEVLIWDQNHPTNRLSWEVKAERFGCSVRSVSTPESPRTIEDLVAPFREAMTPATRVLAFSHVSNASGIQLPARELCRLAAARGALTLVDGAQSFGALQLDLHDMGCDFYTASSHKWFMGPKEAGILFVRRERVAGLWASNVGVGWTRALEHGAQKFDNLGQRDDACVAAMGTAARFQGAIGGHRVETRVREIVDALRSGLAARVPGMRFQPDAAAESSAGILIAVPPSGDVRALYDSLYREHSIASAPRPTGIRLSPHIYNTMSDVERVVDAFAALTG